MCINKGLSADLAKLVQGSHDEWDGQVWGDDDSSQQIQYKHLFL